MSEIIDETWLLENLPDGWTYDCRFSPDAAFLLYASEGPSCPRYGPFVLPLRLLHNPGLATRAAAIHESGVPTSRQVTVDRSLLLSLMEPLRLAHVYALKDSHPEELDDDFKPHKWDGHEIQYALQASDAYRALLDAILAYDESQSGIPE